MKKKLLPSLLAVAAVSAAFSCSAIHAASPGGSGGSSAETLTLQRIFTDPPLQGLLPRQAELSPGGHWASYLRPSEADSELLELWAQPLDGGAPRRLVAVSDLIGKASARLTEAEKMALERRRISGGGIVEYQWCGEDDKHLIVPLSGDLYLVNLGDSGVTTRRLTHETGEPAREPQCDKAGQRIAYVKQGDLWVQDLTSVDGAGARQLTHTGSATHSTGLAEFIAEEELDRHQGFWWSPDGKRLLAMEVDESGVPVKVRAQIFADRTAMTEQRYPAAGEANAKVRAIVIDVDGGKTSPLALPAEAEYVTRAGWFADGTPWLQWMPRDQRALHLVEFDSQTAAPRELLAERDPAWVEVHDDLRELPGLTLSGKPALLWSSERSGRRQLYSLDRGTGVLSPLTAQSEPVAHVVCTAGERVVFAGATQGGRGRELFELSLNDAAAEAKMIDPGEARRWRDATGDDSCTQLLITESAWGVPPHSAVLSLSGRRQAIALTGTAPDPLLARIKPEAQALDLLAADGTTRLNAVYLAPLTPKVGGQHPVVVFAYGGPGVSTVGWHWDRDVPLFAYLQRQGFGVMMVDTRGMADRDREFTRAHDHAFGKVEVADLFAAVHQLPQRVEGVDPKRIAFRGWSYGGYLAGRAILDADTPFSAAIAIAPPTDWTLYDTAYTERYLGLPDGGKAPAYADASLLTRAKLLSKPLLIVHGTADDNVLFENTLRLIDALQNEGKLFELDIYPGKAHGIAGRKAQLHLAETEVDFLLRHLKPQ